MKRTLRNRTTPAWTGGASRHTGAVLLVVAIGMVVTWVAFPMGGLLTVHSDGPELGATFTRELPIRPVSVEQGLPISMPTVISLAGAPA